MLRLILNNTVLDFEGKIRLKMCSPLFYDENTHSYEIFFPRTPVNDTAFAYAAEPDSLAQYKEFENFCIETDTQQMFGSLTIRRTNSSGYYCFFVENDKTQKIKDLNLNIIRQPLHERVKIFYPNVNDDTADIGGYQWYTNKFLDLGNAHSYIHSILEVGLGALKIKLNYDISAIENDFKRLLLFSNRSSALFRKMYNPGAYYIIASVDTKPDTTYITVTHGVYQTEQTPQKPFPEEPFLAYFNVENGLPFFKKYHEIQLVEEFDPVITFFPGSIINGRVERADEWRFVYKAKFRLTKTVYPVQSYWPMEIGRVCFTYTDIYNLSHTGSFLPNITLGELIKALENLFFVKFIYNDKARAYTIVMLKNVLAKAEYTDITHYVAKITESAMPAYNGYEASYTPDGGDSLFAEKLKPLLSTHTEKDSVANVADLPTTGNSNNDIRLVRNTNEYYLFSFSGFDERFESGGGGSWQFYSFAGYPEKSTATNPYKVNTKASPLTPMFYKMKENPLLPYLTTFKLAFGGNVYFTNKLTENTYNAIRLFFYRQNPNASWLGNQYIAGIDDRDDNNNEIPGTTLSLAYNSPKSPVNACGKEWLEFMQTSRSHNAQIEWPGYMLADFNWLDTYAINGTPFLIKSIDLELDNNGYQLNKTELMQK